MGWASTRASLIHTSSESSSRYASTNTLPPRFVSQTKGRRIAYPREWSNMASRNGLHQVFGPLAVYESLQHETVQATGAHNDGGCRLLRHRLFRPLHDSVYADRSAMESASGRIMPQSCYPRADLGVAKHGYRHYNCISTTAGPLEASTGDTIEIGGLRHV